MARIMSRRTASVPGIFAERSLPKQPSIPDWEKRRGILVALLAL